jgi:hypothetical protein
VSPSSGSKSKSIKKTKGKQREIAARFLSVTCSAYFSNLKTEEVRSNETSAGLRRQKSQTKRLFTVTAVPHMLPRKLTFSQY